MDHAPPEAPGPRSPIGRAKTLASRIVYGEGGAAVALGHGVNGQPPPPDAPGASRSSQHGPDLPDGSGRLLDQLDVWRKQLINLARSNRLLYFRHTRSSTLEISGEPERLHVLVSDLLAGKGRHFYMPPDDVPDEEGVVEGINAIVPPDTLVVTTKNSGRELRKALQAHSPRPARLRCSPSACISDGSSASSRTTRSSPGSPTPTRTSR